jgi:thymidylate synthase ThyX
MSPESGAVAPDQTHDSPLATHDYPTRRIYAVAGVPPEIQAYALAKYSRSAQGMLESIQELSQQKAEEFLNTFYFQYGHRSIADLAHLVFGLEQISILAAIAVVDEPVWDGQERSTRYQPFRKTGWHLPDEVAGTPAEATFADAAEGLFAAYQQLSAALLERLVESVPRPDSMPDGAYRRTLRARAFDVARGLLPLATHTSVGQVVSARTLERQIARLLGSEYGEVRAVGRELKGACQRAPEAPLGGDGQPAAAPTLVKYADASAYPSAVAREFGLVADASLVNAGPPDRSRLVDLVEPAVSPLDEIVATLLYRHDLAGHSYRQCLQVVAELSQSDKEDLFGRSLISRARHDDVLREHQAGYALVFDILVDLGSFRDLHRHRRCIQIAQPLTWSHGYLRADEVVPALEGDLAALYASALSRAAASAGQVRQVSPEAADYLLPMAYRTRCLFKMDWAQAAYMIEARTAPAGHFSYRRVAWQMYQALRARYPALAEPIRATDPDAGFNLLER